jgi:hypothetical protein
MSSIPYVIGKPAAGLKNAKWAASAGAAKAGSDGEVMTAAVMNKVALSVAGPTVLHDVRIPLPGVSANIDHLIVSGGLITIVDSKMWKPGFYWTMFGRSFRGTESFPHANKQTMVMAADALEKLGADNGVSVAVVNPLMVIWSSRKYPKLKVDWLKPTGAKAITGEDFTKKLPRMFGKLAADPEVINLLLPLVAQTTLTAKSVSRSVPDVSYTEEAVPVKRASSYAVYPS